MPNINVMAQMTTPNKIPDFDKAYLPNKSFLVLIHINHALIRGSRIPLASWAKVIKVTGLTPKEENRIPSAKILPILARMGVDFKF